MQPALLGATEMDTSQIVQGLQRQFDQRRVVFWNDPEREFTEVVGALDLPDVTLLRLDETPALAVKLQIERTDPQGRYLLYAPFEAPTPEEDWLLDLRLYGGTFRADRASMLLHELGLGGSQSLRPHLNKRMKFLNSKDRLSRLKKLVSEGDTPTDLDRKMLAVLLRSDHSEPFALLTALYHDMAIQSGGLDGLPSAWEEIVKFGLDARFWEWVMTAFGYQEEMPKLRSLLIRLLTSDFAQSLHAPIPATLKHFVLPKDRLPNVAVFMNQWRDSSTRGVSYDRLSNAVADALQLSHHFGSLPVEALADSFTFMAVEKLIASELRDQIVNASVPLNGEWLSGLISRRKDGHWASAQLPSTPDVPRRAFLAVYQALEQAQEFLALWQAHSQGFSYPSALAMLTAYQTELYRFDQLYRHFCEADDAARKESWEVLKPLREKVEAAYSNGYLTRLGLKWGEFLEDGLLNEWRIEGIPHQYRFYEKQVKPILDDGVKRVFVLISDAFRYEAAQELTALLNGRYRFHATLSSQLGVLPSYTALGMAALLPHQTLSYTAKGDVLADGISTSGTENRSAILGAVGGVAITADALLKMKKEEGRAFIRDYRVVYIYHNQIDAVGDSASTEEDTFGAVREAIEELANLVRHVINSLNGSVLLITADHGFLFEELPPDVTDKSSLEEKPQDALIAKKRYLIGHTLPPEEKAYHGRLSDTAGVTGDEEFWIPKGTNRFHFTGGARYFHGGAMPQEIVVPILTVKELHGGAADSSKTRPVIVQIIGSNLKVTTNRHRFQLIQTEAVSDRLKPITLQIALYDGETPISNIETLTFDSASSEMNDRIKTLFLSLKSQTYDKKRPYPLILRNAEEEIEVTRQDVTIDLAFSNDF